MNPGVRKILIAVLVVGVVGVLLYVKQSKRPVPVEANRWVHPAGFSIVVPEGWFVETDLGSEPGIRMYPKEQAGPQVSLFVRAYEPSQSPPTDGVHWKDSTFQSKPAREYEREERDRLGWRVVFNRDGLPFQISAITSPSEPASTGWLRAFADSFRLEQATNRPTTLNIVVPD
jgi:hypothetical protein